MRRDDLIRIRHMLDAPRDAIRFAGDKTRADLDDDRMLTLSLVKCVEIIGETASKVTEETQESRPEIPWSVIVAMRNRLIHGYYDMDLDRIWDTVAEDLPPLVVALEKIVSREKGS